MEAISTLSFSEAHQRNKPKALDLFCGAGGASMGMANAGFDVTGMDIRPQPRYPFRFLQGDALTADLRGYDFVWASPPCQAHCDLKKMHNAKRHEDLIPATRRLLAKSGKPYVIENVEGAPLHNPIMLCGTMFGLGSCGAELRRHRLFEINWGFFLPPCCNHSSPRVIGVYGGHGRDRRRTVNTQDFPTEARREAMGIWWMTGSELSQAIPPAYLEYLCGQLFLTGAVAPAPQNELPIGVARARSLVECEPQESPEAGKPEVIGRTTGYTRRGQHPRVTEQYEKS